MDEVDEQQGSGAVDLLWIPLGAGRRVVRRCGRVYESLVAWRERREPLQLYHAALEVQLDDRRYVIESAPAWDRPEPDRGVVGEGPVGLAWLGRFRAFRYEVRCWSGGRIPDAHHAVGGPRRVSADRRSAAEVLALAPRFPTATWGRDELHAGEMWNSNSLVAWLLACSGHELGRIAPPVGGRAPGWGAGLAVAGRAEGPHVRLTPR